MFGKFDEKVKAVLSSKSAQECANAILDFSSGITAEDIEDLKKNLGESQLGNIVFKSGLYNTSGSHLSPEAEQATLEWIASAPDNDIIPWINQTMRRYLADRFDRNAIQERKDRALGYMELWDSLNREINSFFTLRYPLLAKALEPSRNGIQSLNKDLSDTVMRAGKLAIPLTACSQEIFFKDTSRRVGLECKYMASAYRALRFDYSDNRLISMAKKAAAVPPSLQEKFWGTAFIQPMPAADFATLIESVRVIGSLILQKKFNDAKEKIQLIGENYLKTAMELLNDGNTDFTIKKILNIKKETLLSKTSLLHDICLKGVLGIQSSFSPGIIREMKPGRPDTLEYPGVEEIVNGFIYFSEKARREGFLALEDDIMAHAPTTDMKSPLDDENLTPGEELFESEYLEDKSAGEFVSPENKSDGIPEDGDGLEYESAEYSITAPERLGDFVTKALTLVINGTDPDIVRNILRDEADRRLSLLGTLHRMMIEGALSVQCGDNPLIVKEILSSYADSGAEIDVIFERISRLASKARKMGLFALDEDIGSGKEDFLSFFLRLAINDVSPDIIRETAHQSSARILEETAAYCDVCITAVSYLYEGIDPSEGDLTSGIPFYGSDIPALFSSDRTLF